MLADALENDVAHKENFWNFSMASVERMTQKSPAVPKLWVRSKELISLLGWFPMNVNLRHIDLQFKQYKSMMIKHLCSLHAHYTQMHDA